jgi:hypothetical protein
MKFVDERGRKMSFYAYLNAVLEYRRVRFVW